jgi:hypothetical protein
MRSFNPGIVFSILTALVGVAGCLLVTPLDDAPTAKGGATQGGSGGAGGKAQITPDGGHDAEAGDGGEPSSGDCETNADCATLSHGTPYRCLPSSHSCVQLTNDACPLSYGEEWEDPNAVYFGAFAALNPVRPEDNSILWAHRLALQELNGDGIGGVPDGPGGARRPLVMIVCNNANDEVEAGVQHLVEDLQVPAVLATLKPGDLRRAYENKLGRDTFFLSPVAVTSAVVTEEDDGHIWNLLGQPSDFAPTYAALLSRAEAYVRKQRQLDADVPLNVALVTTGDAFDSELANAITPELAINGKAATADTEHFVRFELPPAPDAVAEAAAIGDFQPDIVVSAASESFLMKNGVQEQLEGNWAEYSYPADPKPGPFYILSPYNAGNLVPLQGRIAGRLDAQPSLQEQQRYVGVSIAAAADSSLQNAYAVRLISAFDKALTDTANYYDAVYYLAFAMRGADQPNGLTGSGIARGMKRLLEGPRFQLGPSSASQVFAALAKPGVTVDIESTLGPPGFDPATGVRAVEGSVFCFSRTKNTTSALFDQLRYSPSKKGLIGDLSCIPDF